MKVLGFVKPGVPGSSFFCFIFIARVFRELNLIEQWGSGIRRIFKEAEEQGLPEPQIIEVGMRVRFIVPLKVPIAISVVPEQVEAKVEAQVKSSGVESGVESTMAREIIGFLKEKSLSKLEIAKHLGKVKTTRYLNDLMNKLIQSGHVEYTIPEKPNSRLQKYQLTEKGKAYLNSIIEFKRCQ